MEIFKELEVICSQDNNKEAQRDVLEREGTAKRPVKTADTGRHMQKFLEEQVRTLFCFILTYCNIKTIFQNMYTTHGTIPHLSIFLFDLTMMHHATPDKSPKTQLINFDKKRKEFQILAHIKLLQGAAKSYRLDEDPAFDRWLDNVPEISDDISHSISCQLEPPDPKEKKKGHRKSDSIASNSSSGGGSQEYSEIMGG